MVQRDGLTTWFDQVGRKRSGIRPPAISRAAGGTPTEVGRCRIETGPRQARKLPRLGKSDVIVDPNQALRGFSAMSTLNPGRKLSRPCTISLRELRRQRAADDAVPNTRRDIAVAKSRTAYAKAAGKA